MNRGDDGQSDDEFRAEARAGLNVEFAAEDLNALAHVGQAEPAFASNCSIGGGKRQSLTVVRNQDLNFPA